MISIVESGLRVTFDDTWDAVLRYDDGAHEAIAQCFDRCPALPATGRPEKRHVLRAKAVDAIALRRGRPYLIELKSLAWGRPADEDRLVGSRNRPPPLMAEVAAKVRDSLAGTIGRAFDGSRFEAECRAFVEALSRCRARVVLCLDRPDDRRTPETYRLYSSQLRQATSWLDPDALVLMVGDPGATPLGLDVLREPASR